MIELLYEIIDFIVNTVSKFGYIGIFVMMVLESSFFPFPSEVVIIPAGYLAHKGDMNIYAVLFSSVSGSLVGALINYYIALLFGRKIIIKYGKYVLFKEEYMVRVDDFFNKHGSLSTFNGRLIPVVRQYISFPAGIAKMNLAKFCIYTSLGAFIWSIILFYVGYFLGDNQELIKEYLKTITISVIIFVSVLTLIYIKYKRSR